MYDCWICIVCVNDIYILYLIIHKNQETNHNINVKVKFKIHFQLKLYLQFTLMVILLGHGDLIQN